MKINARILTILTTLLVTASFFGCGTREQTTDTLADADSVNRPDAVVRGARIYLYNRGTLTTAVAADIINNFDDIDSAMGYRLDIDLFDSSGQAGTHIVADSGVIRENSNIMNLFGHVVVTTSDSTRMDTDYLRWNPGTNRIQTDAFVKITKKGDVITGWGMEADRELSRIKILRQVSGSME